MNMETESTRLKRNRRRAPRPALLALLARWLVGPECGRINDHCSIGRWRCSEARKEKKDMSTADGDKHGKKANAKQEETTRSQHREKEKKRKMETRRRHDETV